MMSQIFSRTRLAMGVLFSGVILSANVACAQAAKQLVGTWRLISATTEQGDKTNPTYGLNPKGILAVDANGRYAIVTMRADLPKVASGTRTTTTSGENQALVAGSIAHFGSISLNKTGTVLIFKVENSTFPNWDGTEQKWPFNISREELRFAVPDASGGGTALTAWRRVN